MNRTLSFPINNKDITILIPSKSRPKNLSALLGYFEKSQVVCKIVVLESGNSYRNLLGDFPHLDIELHTFDPDISFGSKLLSGAQLVKTSLVCICTDDDLVLKDSIDQCAAFLTDHQEYSACQGYHARFEQRDLDFYLLDFLWFTPSLEASDPLKRLQNLITRYQPICWAVFRIEVILRLHRIFSDIQSLLFFELLWSSMAAITGKVKRIPMLYCLRKNDPLQLVGHPLYLFAESPEKFFRDYLAYRGSLQKALYPDKQPSAHDHRILDLMHACLFHNASDLSTLQYVTQKAMENPEASVFDSALYPSIQQPAQHFSEEGNKMVQRGIRRYHLSEKFLNPEPSDEIKVSPNFHLKLLSDLDKFHLTT